MYGQLRTCGDRWFAELFHGAVPVVPSRRATGANMPTTCKKAGGAQQVVGDRRAEHPRGVRPEAPRWHVRQGSVDEVGEDGFDDRAVDTIGPGYRRSCAVASPERMMPPHREQRVGVAGVLDAAHDQPGGNRSRGGSKSGVGGFGDLGIFRSPRARTCPPPARRPVARSRLWAIAAQSSTGPRCSCPGPARSTLSRAGTPR